MQTAVVYVDSMTVRIDLPSSGVQVLPGVRWGSVDAFPTPAYWTYQVMARRILGRSINYKLGATLREEIGACLLGGHGIPANIGIAAFKALRNHGAFGLETPSEAQVLDWLLQPIELDGRSVRYRFAKQKARYVAAAMQRMAEQPAPESTGRALRDWLLEIPGIGFKTSSWIARNWLNADDVAILDIHILRAGHLAGLFPAEMTVEKDYLELEALFLEFSKGLGVKASELDAVIWLEMMSSPTTVRQLMDPAAAVKHATKRSKATTNHRHSNARQSALFV